jgi:hypothetical protein
MWLRKWVEIALILSCAACASAARLVWDANTESDLAGYRIHYASVHGPPYSHTVDVGNVTQWPIPTEWPRNQDYFFAATAYDRDGYESLFSNEAIYYRDTVAGPALATAVRVTFQQTTPEPPMAIDLTLEYEIIGTDYRTNTTLSKPSNTADGDFLIAFIHIAGGTYSITPPDGWTLVASLLNGTGGGLSEVFYKRASSEGNNWTWGHDYQISKGAVKRFTGVVASGNPEDVAESTADTDYISGPVTNPAITTATAGAAIVQLCYISNAITATHALTNRVTNSTGSYVLWIDADLQASAGSTGTKSISSWSDWGRANSILIALKPAAAGGSIVPLLLNQYRARRQ